jgi:hypothetical protein
LFAEPIGFGSVDIWGNNERETGKIPNRRVRILVNIGTPPPGYTPPSHEQEKKTGFSMGSILKSISDFFKRIFKAIGNFFKKIWEFLRGLFMKDNESGSLGYGFPWWILIILIILVLLVIFVRFVLPQIVGTIGSVGGGSTGIPSPKVSSSAPHKFSPFMSHTDASKSNEGIPISDEEDKKNAMAASPDLASILNREDSLTEIGLRKAGYSKSVITRVVNEISPRCPEEGKNGHWTQQPGKSTFIFNPEIAKSIADPNIRYLEDGYKENLGKPGGDGALAEMVNNMSPERRNTLIQNYKDLRDGKVGLDYEYGGVITNMDKYAYDSVNVSEMLGKKTFATERYGRDDKYGRLGSVEEANLCMAMKHGKLSSIDSERIKELSRYVDKNPPEECAAEIQEMRTIFNKCPNYYMDGMAGHEHIDLSTVYNVPSGNFHSGGEGAGKAPHNGGHEYLKKAETIYGKV